MVVFGFGHARCARDIARLGVVKSMQLTVSWVPQKESQVALTAGADVDDQVDEVDETDNEKAVDVVAKNVGNLTFTGFTVAVSPDDAAKFRFTFAVVNNRSAAVDGPFNVRFTATTGAGEAVDWGGFATYINLAAGATYDGYSDIAVASGTYAAKAKIDCVCDQSDLTDDEATYSFSTP